MEKLKIIECPRDAMQGIKEFIPTASKVAYINQLLKVGFDTIDFGSFVSPRAIPQMKDTPLVMDQLDLSNTKSKLLSIVANQRGAEKALAFEAIDYLGYPFSISETFQQRNTNTSIEGSLIRLDNICNQVAKANRKIVIYLSMGFGNPYNEPWHPDLIIEWAEKLNQKFDVEILALSDTIGVATPPIIKDVLNTIIPALPHVEIGVHLHTTQDTYAEKVAAAYKAGCRRFDGAIRGFGGCPMAKDDLVGNMPTEKMIAWMDENNVETGLIKNELATAIQKSSTIF